MQDITTWVTNTHNKKAFDKQNFNVNPYTAKEKQAAIDGLKVEGFTCSLENHDNSLKVVKD